MPYKPMDEKTYRQYLRIVGWHLIKGGIDYKLLDENGAFLSAIKIAHGKKSKQEVIAYNLNFGFLSSKLRDSHTLSSSIRFSKRSIDMI